MTGFSDQEREEIYQQLLETGRQLFSQYGVKKTTVSELTDAVGIAEGTFYRFFDSKDELYWAVLETERDRVEAEYAAAVANADGPRNEMIALLESICDEIETNPLVKPSLEGTEFERMIRNMSEDELAEANQQAVGFFHQYIESWQAAEAIPDADPDLIGGMFRAITFIALHKETMGPAYPEIRSFLIETIVEGLLEN